MAIHFRRLINHSISTVVFGFVVYHFYEIEKGTDSQAENGMMAFGLVWLIMLYVLLLFRIQCGLPYLAFLKRFRSFETYRFYELLGIQVFRWLLLHSPFRYANRDIYLKSGRGREAAQRLLEKMEEAEFAHIINFILILVLAPLFSNLWPWLILWNIVFNLYPIFLQRYHRLRLNRLLY